MVLTAPSICSPPLQDAERAVTREEGHAFARDNGCLYVETSAKVNIAVGQVRRALGVPPSLFHLRSSGSGIQPAQQMRWRAAGASFAWWKRSCSMGSCLPLVTSSLSRPPVY